MKHIAVYWKYLKYLVWLGLVLVTAGVVAGLLLQWQPVSIGLLAAGVAILALWFFSLGQAQPEFWGQRSTQAGTNALVATLAVFVILGAVNLLGARYSQRVDLTENQIFTLAPESQQVVQDLEQPVKIWVFDVNRNAQDRQLLESYQQQSDRFSYEYTDPNAQPRLAQRFEVRTLGEVHLEVGDQHQLVQRVNQTDRLSEQKLTNRLAQIGSDRAPKAYFLTGHGEYDVEGLQGGLSQARDSLEQKGYDVEALDLASVNTVPQDADVVIVAGPQQELFPPEVNALETYVNAGGGLLLLIDPNTNPNLDALLQDWGVTLDDRLILDTSGRGQAVGLGPAAPLITNYGTHPITEAFGTGRSFYPLARPIEVTEKADVTAAPILMTDEQTQAGEISQEGSFDVDPNQAPQGPLSVGVALSRSAEKPPAAETEATEETAETSESPQPSPTAEDETAAPSSQENEVTPAPASPTPEATGSSESQAAEDAELDIADAPTPAEPDASAQEGEAQEARLVIIGNSTFATDGLFNQQLNGDVFLNAVSWLSQQEDATLSIRPKEVTNRRILMPIQKQILLGVLSWLVFPLLGFGIALVMWWRRR